MHEGDDFANGLVEHGGVASLQSGHAESFNGLEAGEHGGTNGTKGHGHGVEHQADNGGAEGREAEAEEQGSGQSSGGTEAGSTFDEGTEHEADDDGLAATVRGDLLHAGLDGFHGAGVGEGVVDEQGAEHDDQHAGGGDEAFKGEGSHADEGEFPHGEGEHSADAVSDGHGTSGRPTKAGHHDQSRKEGQEREHSKQFDRHKCLLGKKVNGDCM